ncbi:MAG: hypothetical protein HYV17_11220 [Xanthomonadales bacterium]|nr:hypothetical protein [Xanthomonadales bacterium]
MAIATASSAWAQSNLFSWQGQPGSVEHPRPNIRGAEREWPVGVNIRAVMASERARSSIRVLVPGRPPLVFQQRNVEPLRGFRILDNFDYEPDPAVPDSGLTYTWYGSSGSKQMTMSVYEGRVSATIQFDDRVFSISSRDGQQVVRQFDPGQMLGDADAGIEPEVGPSEIVAPKKATPMVAFAAKSAVDFVDILVVHTPAAFASLGNDQAQLNAVGSEAFQQSEQSFSNAGVNTLRVRNVLAGNASLSEPVDYDEDSGWTCAGSNAVTCRWVGHRVWLRTDATVQSLRNTYGADLVVMLVADNGTGGLAYTQRTDCGTITNYEATPGCAVGAAYGNFAYSVVWVGQATVFQIFAHETGHQFGMEHQSGSATPSYPWSFARSLSDVQTIMGVSLFTRSLQYSNPNVPFIGRTEPSGETLRFNARTAYCLAPVMSGYRTPGQILRLFWDSYEDWLIPTSGC